jgi:hypothetical protein
MEGLPVRRNPNLTLQELKKAPTKLLLVQKEYVPDDEEDEGEEVGVASITIAKPTPSSSIFASSNESKCISHNGTCLMTHTIKISPSFTSIISTSLFLMNCDEKYDYGNEPSEMDKFLSTLRGVTKTYLCNLLPSFRNINYFSFVKRVYLNIF